VKTIRVGSVVYQDGKRFAEHTHGAWYRYKKRPRGMELEPCDQEESARYESMVDALKAPVSDGEMEVLRHAEQIVASTKLWKDQKLVVMECVREGVLHGIGKHGPYDASKDERDLVEKMIKNASNVIVYACMHLSKTSSKRDAQEVIGAADAMCHVIVRLMSTR